MNLLIIDRFPVAFLDQLAALPVQFNYQPEIKRPEVLELISDIDILIMNSKVKVDQELADKANRLKLVLRAGVGMDHIDMEYLASKGIVAQNTAGANADSVGEQTVGMLLTLRHHLIRANAQVKQFDWQREQNRAAELTQKTIGIIGYGNTGKAVAKRLAGFEAELLVYDKYVSDFGHDHIKEVSLEEIYERADVLSFHVPLTSETREWVHDDLIERMAKPFMLLNLARGPIVNLDALARGLKTGKITAAALDVLPNEKMHKLSSAERSVLSELFEYENVIFAPHIGGWSHESLRNINNRLVAYVKELLEG
ncbi:MAG: NAD(P)-dependent oxidoreductase [Bacteroidia bacterium]